jgi:hypothetical protein
MTALLLLLAFPTFCLLGAIWAAVDEIQRERHHTIEGAVIDRLLGQWKERDE